MENKEHLQEELKEITPLLASLPKVNPFRVPEKYFDGLVSETLIAVGIKELDERNIEKKSSPFKIPGEYFENLSAEILEEVRRQETEKRQRGRILSFNRRLWWTAASVAIIMIISISLFRGHKVETASAAPIDTTYLLLENASGLSEAMVVEFYTAELPATSEDSSLNQYLPDATGIDAEIIYSL